MSARQRFLHIRYGGVQILLRHPTTRVERSLLKPADSVAIKHILWRCGVDASRSYQQIVSSVMRHREKRLKADIPVRLS